MKLKWDKNSWPQTSRFKEFYLEVTECSTIDLLRPNAPTPTLYFATIKVLKDNADLTKPEYRWYKSIKCWYNATTIKQARKQIETYLKENTNV